MSWFNQFKHIALNVCDQCVANKMWVMCVLGSHPRYWGWPEWHTMTGNVYWCFYQR